LSKDRIVIHASKANGSSGVFVGFVFIILGFVFSILTMNPIGLLVFGAIGSYYAFSFYGFEVSKDRTKFREYFNYLGLKRGKWRPVSEMPFITVFHIGQTERVYGGRTMLESSSTEKVFKIYLLSPTHRERALIKITPDEKEAQQLTEQLIDELDIEYTKFQPKRSSRKR
jgi:hypothetical protein